jgi:hypothetical protein
MTYRVGPDDALVWVSPEWDRFALANGGEAAVAARVLCRPLWDFVAGLTTRDVYRRVLRRARARHPVRFTARCDSPGARRLLEVELGDAGGGAVEFRTRPLREEARPPVPWPAAGADGMLRMCGWCNRVCVEGRWVEVEDAVARLGLFSRPHVPAATHGICDPCYRSMTRVVGQAPED